LGRSLAVILMAAAAAGQTPLPTQPSQTTPQITAQTTTQTTSADPLAQFRQTVEKKTADWDTLAKGLEMKLARMLPCDPRVRSTIEEVSRASEARLAAVAQYLQAAATLAKGEAERAQRALADQEAAGKDIDTERAEAGQERAAIEGQTVDLAESVKRREVLSEARNKLADIAGMARERAAHADDQALHREALTASLRDVAAAYQVRQKALDAEVRSLVVEISRWGEYYIGRLARARTECSVTNQSSSQRKRK
jgi:hypothetical protein